jgi:hypothetical protein
MKERLHNRFEGLLNEDGEINFRKIPSFPKINTIFPASTLEFRITVPVNHCSNQISFRYTYESYDQGPNFDDIKIL